MKLKSYENEALELINLIWSDDISTGEVVLDPIPFSSEAISLEGVDQGSPLSVQRVYRVKDLRSIFLLKKLKIIKRLTPESLFIKKVAYSPNEDEYEGLAYGDVQFHLDYYHHQDYVAFQKLKSISPDEEISYAYTFDVGKKLKTLLNPEELRSEILKARGMDIPTLVAEYEKLKVLDNGGIFYSEEKIKNLNPKSQQYILLINILMNDKQFLTFDELKRCFKRSDIELREHEDLQYTYENLNKILRSSTPYIISKVDFGYFFRLNPDKVINQ